MKCFTVIVALLILLGYSWTLMYEQHRRIKQLEQKSELLRLLRERQ